jgi:hypothetical protein
MCGLNFPGVLGVAEVSLRERSHRFASAQRNLSGRDVRKKRPAINRIGRSPISIDRFHPPPKLEGSRFRFSLGGMGG